MLADNEVIPNWYYFYLRVFWHKINTDLVLLLDKRILAYLEVITN